MRPMLAFGITPACALSNKTHAACQASEIFARWGGRMAAGEQLSLTHRALRASSADARTKAQILARP
jgi:hypothetical protein